MLFVSRQIMGTFTLLMEGVKYWLMQILQDQAREGIRTLMMMNLGLSPEVVKKLTHW